MEDLKGSLGDVETLFPAVDSLLIQSVEDAFFTDSFWAGSETSIPSFESKLLTISPSLEEEDSLGG